VSSVTGEGYGRVPNPVSFTALPGVRVIRLEFDLTAVLDDLDVIDTGATDLEKEAWQKEGNIDHIEVVISGEDHNRWGWENPETASGATVDPGKDLIGVRKTMKVPVPPNINSLVGGKFTYEIPVEFTQDWYVWARIITAGGGKGKFFPNVGSGAVTTGVGPVVPEGGSNTNLLNRARDTNPRRYSHGNYSGRRSNCRGYYYTSSITRRRYQLRPCS